MDEVVDHLGTVLVLVPPDNLYDPRRRLAQHEDHDDDDHDEGDVVLVVTPPTRHSPSPLLRRAVRHDDLCVDEGQNEEWQDEGEHVVHAVQIHLLVVHVRAESRAVPVRLVVGSRYHLQLEEARQVVEEREGGDHEEFPPHVGQCAQVRGAVRQTHRDEPVRRDDHRQPDGLGLGHEQQRERVDAQVQQPHLQVVVGTAARGAEEVRVEGVERVVRHPEEEEGVVCDGQRLEQEGGDGGTLVLLQHQVRHRVAQEPDETQRDTHHGVEDEAEERTRRRDAAHCRQHGVGGVVRRVLREAQRHVGQVAGVVGRG